MNEDRTARQEVVAAGADLAAFSAVLRPHRSLGPRGFAVLMAAVSIVSFICGAVFWAMGAWPVFGFFGLDVAIIYAGFRLNYRAGRMSERIELNSSRLQLTRVHPSGKAEEFAFNPYWVRVRLAQLTDGRTDLRLASHGRELAFGRFLTDDERREFAATLEEQLFMTRRRRPAV